MMAQLLLPATAPLASLVCGGRGRLRERGGRATGPGRQVEGRRGGGGPRTGGRPRRRLAVAAQHGWDDQSWESDGQWHATWEGRTSELPRGLEQARSVLECIFGLTFASSSRQCQPGSQGEGQGESGGQQQAEGKAECRDTDKEREGAGRQGSQRPMGTPDWAHRRATIALFGLTMATALSMQPCLAPQSLALPVSAHSALPAEAPTQSAPPALGPLSLSLDAAEDAPVLEALQPLPNAAESQQEDSLADPSSSSSSSKEGRPLRLPSPSAADKTVTERVYLDFAVCPTAVRLDRTLGDRSLICSDGQPLGRVVLGLYGNQVPVTVQHFVDMVTGKAGSSYKGSIIHRSLPGQYIMAGHQGAVEKGEVGPPSGLERNTETVQSRSFLLDHGRPGTVSLALSENDDEEERRQSPSYRNVEFLITTGPGPAPQLDSRNVVFGTVLEGMDVIREIAAVPTYEPSDQIRQFNDLAVLLGDERAAKGRSRWYHPLKAVVISGCGLVPVASAPLLPPSLP